MCVFQHDRRLPTQTVNGSIPCFPCASKNTSRCLSAGPSPPAWAPHPHEEHLPRHSWGKTCLIHGTPGRQIDLPKLTIVCGRGRSLFLQSLCRSPLWTLPGHGPGPGWGEPKGHTTGALLAFLHKAGDRRYPQHPRDHHAQDGGGRRSGREGAASLGANGRSRTVGRARHLAVRGGTARRGPRSGRRRAAVLSRPGVRLQTGGRDRLLRAAELLPSPGCSAARGRTPSVAGMGRVRAEGAAVGGSPLAAPVLSALGRREGDEAISSVLDLLTTAQGFWLGRCGMLYPPSHRPPRSWREAPSAHPSVMILLPVRALSRTVYPRLHGGDGSHKTFPTQRAGVGEYNRPGLSLGVCRMRLWCSVTGGKLVFSPFSPCPANVLLLRPGGALGSEGLVGQARFLSVEGSPGAVPSGRVCSGAMFLCSSSVSPHDQPAWKISPNAHFKSCSSREPVRWQCCLLFPYFC